MTKILRSLLVTPATKNVCFDMLANLRADINLLDLEDSVGSSEKSKARSKLSSIKLGKLQSKFALRINSLRTKEGLADLLYLIENGIDPDIIVIPKVIDSSDITCIDNILTKSGLKSNLWALIEHPRGIQNCQEIAGSSSRLSALTFGAADYASSADTAIDWDTLLFARQQIVLAAKAYGLDCYDSPTFSLDGLNDLRQDCLRSRMIGFTGKIAIHPEQIPTINELYVPSESLVSWAREVLTAHDLGRDSIIKVNGLMIGPPFVAKARKILEGVK